jgi:hypothetical protein
MRSIKIQNRRSRRVRLGSDSISFGDLVIEGDAMPTLEEEGVRAIGIAWMREEDYPALIRIFEDGHMFGSWEEWSERAEATEKKFQSEGVIVLRAYLDPATFPAWCAARNIDPGREARTRFGIEFAEERYGRNQS